MTDPRNERHNLIIPPPRRYEGRVPQKQRIADLEKRCDRLEQIVLKLHAEVGALQQKQMVVFT